MSAEALTQSAQEAIHSKAWLMPYEEKVNLVVSKEWKRTGHWDNWFHPVSGWNYDLQGAVVSILEDEATAFADAMKGE